jgi:ribosomal protein S18 acetylase RimI-like enzyme
MSDLVTGIRLAKHTDAAAISGVFDVAWREAYRGIIPGVQLERMVLRRGPKWWGLALRRGRPLAVIDVDKKIVGYAAYGRCRDATLPADGEVDELYLRPEYQGVGLGRRLFRAVLNDLRHRCGPRIVVWSLAENERSCTFYESMGGRRFREKAERIGETRLEKVAYLFG